MRVAVESIRIGATFIRKYDPSVYFYVLAMWATLTMAYQIKTLNAQVADMKGKVIYDIDKVREQMLGEMDYMFSRGCRVGIDYPEEYRMIQTGFNQHSPGIYCNDERMKLNDYIYEKLRQVGR